MSSMYYDSNAENSMQHQHHDQIVEHAPDQNSTSDTESQTSSQSHIPHILITFKNTCKKSTIDALKGTKRHFLQLLFALALFTSCAYFNTFCQVIVQNLVIDKGKEHLAPLIDAGFEYLPDLSSWKNLPDNYVTFMALAVLLKTFVRRRFSCVLMIIKRYLVIHAILFFLRGISITITVLPNPWEQCAAERFDNIFLAPLQIMMGSRRTCFDVLYSGHSCAITLTALIWIQYETNTIIQLIWIPVAIGGYLSLVASHFHYSIDVMYGFILAVTIWGVYHYTARRLRFLAVQRYREYGDFKILSPFSDAKPYDAYTNEEKEYISKIKVDPAHVSAFNRFTLLFHNQYSLPKLLSTRMAVQFFKWFECWNEDLEHDANSPLLPLVRENSKPMMAAPGA